eukprot:GHVS01091705.1.p1 GENE.GHVS01091705.1~~GHVS01091705.1.p1  ORF type:complete len:359 (-),score=43.72 GHVS01091705.1:217-1170(-)
MAVDNHSREPVSVCRLGVEHELHADMTELSITCGRIPAIQNTHLCPNIKILSLTSNHIEKIENLEHVPLLEKLDLYQNVVQKIENISHLTHLRVLDLSFNNIHKMENISCFLCLEELYLSSNKIAKIEGLENCLKLQILELGSNRIREVQCISQLQELRELWLGRNKLTSMALPRLPNLQRLSVQSNRLQEWSSELFDNCPNLQELYLSHNRIGTPPEEIQKLTRLRLIDLGSNRVESVGTLCAFSHLEDLWLNNNCVSSIQEITQLKSLKNLKTLYVEGNPLQAQLGPGYRQSIITLLPDLQQLDAVPIVAARPAS